jgi:hypothetical protein
MPDFPDRGDRGCRIAMHRVRDMPGLLSHTSVRIVPVPAADDEFGRCVRQAARELDDVGAVEAQVRSQYPNVRLRTSELSGTDKVVYAYRDGNWQPPFKPS